MVRFVSDQVEAHCASHGPCGFSELRTACGRLAVHDRRSDSVTIVSRFKVVKDDWSTIVGETKGARRQ